MPRYQCAIIIIIIIIIINVRRCTVIKKDKNAEVSLQLVCNIIVTTAKTCVHCTAVHVRIVTPQE